MEKIFAAIFIGLFLAGAALTIGTDMHRSACIEAKMTPHECYAWLTLMDKEN